MADTRDTTIDGLRAVAALGVVFTHAVAFRWSDASYPGAAYLQRLVGPLSETSVLIFFVISGYIITLLLRKEEAATGRFSLLAFYVRRICRIMPPLVLFYAGLLACDGLGLIALDGPSMVSAATFTCNLGLVDCQWWVAHTWSLSVEEQFYLFWPALLLLVATRRSLLLCAGIAAALILFLVMPFSFHSNYISFSCIGLGALWALSGRLRAGLTRWANSPLWIAAGLALMLGPVFAPTKPMQLITPFLILYVVAAARELGWVRTVMALPPIQWIGTASYSLYLWQQLFLADPALYRQGPLPLWLLPIAVVASVLLVERPFIRLGRKLSAALHKRNQAARPRAELEAEAAVLPAP